MAKSCSPTHWLAKTQLRQMLGFGRRHLHTKMPQVESEVITRNDRNWSYLIVHRVSRKRSIAVDKWKSRQAISCFRAHAPARPASCYVRYSSWSSSHSASGQARTHGSHAGTPTRTHATHAAGGNPRPPTRPDKTVPGGLPRAHALAR